MAGTAILVSKLVFMGIVLAMARQTVRGGAKVYIVYMAGRTYHVNMQANKFEGCQIVIHQGRGPTIGIVAATTVRGKAALMCILGIVTGEAITRSVLQVRQRTSINMALRTSKRRMFSN